MNTFSLRCEVEEKSRFMVIFRSGAKQSGLVRMSQPPDRYCHIVIYGHGSESV